MNAFKQTTINSVSLVDSQLLFLCHIKEKEQTEKLKLENLCVSLSQKPQSTITQLIMSAILVTFFVKLDVIFATNWLLYSEGKNKIKIFK